jgi:hypothetical protein
LRVAVLPPGGAWSINEAPLANVPAGENNPVIGARFGLDGLIDSQGQLVLAFAGGGPGLFTCASSDLVIATRAANGSWSFQVPVSGSGACCSAAECNNASTCTRGTDVGHWAAVAERSNGSLAASFSDFHNFVDDVGQTFQGLELWEEGGAVTGIRPYSGFGNFAALRFLPDDTLVSAYTGYEAGGLFFARRTGTGGLVTDWEPQPHRDLKPSATIGERISMAVTPAGKVGIAAYVRLGSAGEVAEDLVYCESADGGVTWNLPACEPVDTMGSVGQNPSLAFDSQGRPMISYYYCGAASDCAVNGDGLRLAWKDTSTNPGTWKRFNVHFDASTRSGMYGQLVVDPATDEPTMVFHDATRGAAMMARGTLLGGD